MFIPNLRHIAILTLFLLIPQVQAESADYRNIELTEFHHLEPVTLNTIEPGKPTYIKMWATWCVPCMEQMPHFEAMYQLYGDKVNFLAVNININEDREHIAEVIERFDLTMPVLLDNDGKLAMALGLIGTPYSVLLNIDHNVVYTTHESDDVLDSFVSRLAQGQTFPGQETVALSVGEQDELLAPWLTGEHLVFFTATWCDWYLADSRPEMSANCTNAQTTLNSLYQKLPAQSWRGVVNHLWTDEQALAEFNELYDMQMDFSIDQSGLLFNTFNVRSIPVLLKIRDGEVVQEITEFDDEDAIVRQLSQNN